MLSIMIRKWHEQGSGGHQLHVPHKLTLAVVPGVVDQHVHALCPGWSQHAVLKYWNGA